MKYQTDIVRGSMVIIQYSQTSLEGQIVMTLPLAEMLETLAAEITAALEQEIFYQKTWCAIHYLPATDEFQFRFQFRDLNANENIIGFNYTCPSINFSREEIHMHLVPMFVNTYHSYKNPKRLTKFEMMS